MACDNQQGKPDQHGRVMCKAVNRRVNVHGCNPRCPAWQPAAQQSERLTSQEASALILGVSLIAGTALVLGTIIWRVVT